MQHMLRAQILGCRAQHMLLTLQFLTALATCEWFTHKCSKKYPSFNTNALMHSGRESLGRHTNHQADIFSPHPLRLTIRGCLRTPMRWMDSQSPSHSPFSFQGSLRQSCTACAKRPSLQRQLFLPHDINTYIGRRRGHACTFIDRSVLLLQVTAEKRFSAARGYE